MRPIAIALLLALPPALAAAQDKPVDRLLLDGYRQYHAGCNHCHGPDGLGSSFGPSLVDAAIEPERFRAAVRDGARGQRGVMKGFADNASVMARLDALEAYIAARSRGELGRGRPR